MHALAEVQDTADRLVLPTESRNAPGTLAIGSAAHLMPSHRSASGRGPTYGASSTSPTAMHAVADVQEIPARRLSRAPIGLRLRRMTQPTPLRASVRVMPAAVPLYPTAMQAAADPQETPLSHMYWPWSGPGVCWTAHLVPFQASARVASVE